MICHQTFQVWQTNATLYNPDWKNTEVLCHEVWKYFQYYNTSTTVEPLVVTSSPRQPVFQINKVSSQIATLETSCINLGAIYAKGLFHWGRVVLSS